MQHLPIVVELINTVPLVGMPLKEATDVVAEHLLVAGFDPDDDFVLAKLVEYDDIPLYIPLTGSMTMLSPDETGPVAAVRVFKAYPPTPDMYTRRVGD